MRNWKTSLLAAAAGSLLMASNTSSFAQSNLASPFGNASPEQQRAAASAEKSKINALRAWDKLPAKVKDSIAGQLAALNQAQRLELLSSTPALKNLSSTEMQALLDNVAAVVPLPSPVKATLSLKSPATTPIPLGSTVELTLLTEWVVTEAYRYFRSLSLYLADGTELNPQGTCNGLKENFGVGQTATVNCTFTLTLTTPNPTFYAVAGIADTSNPKATKYEFRTKNLTLPTSP